MDKTLARAWELVKRSVRKEIQTLAVDANLFDNHLGRTAEMEGASNRRKKLLAAMKLIEEKLQEALCRDG